MKAASIFTENWRTRGGRWTLSSLGLWVLLWSGAWSQAHEGPEDIVTRLSRQMEVEGETPVRLMRRATEYRVLGRLDDAVEDLRSALVLNPELQEAHSELGKIYLAQGHHQNALSVIDQALARAKTNDEQARLLIIRSEIHAAGRRDRAALRDCNRAFDLTEPALDWYLTRSRLQIRLGLFEECSRGLRQGWDQNGSYVLHEEWVEALIRAGHHQKALHEIEPQLAASRWRSSWLLRRAQAFHGMKDEARARADLQEAVTEIEQRLHPEKPDLTLLADRGLARAWLGETHLARADLEAIRKAGASPWMVERLELALLDDNLVEVSNLPRN